VLFTCVQVQLGVPVSQQLLTSLGGRSLHSEGSTLADSGLSHGCTVQLLLRLCGGKGGFGALLRGQGRDGKITDNFDAMRDLSGRRVRHVEAEKKLKAWEQETKERELEQLALKHMKDMARQAKKERDYQVGALGCSATVLDLLIGICPAAAVGDLYCTHYYGGCRQAMHAHFAPACCSSKCIASVGVCENSSRCSAGNAHPHVATWLSGADCLQVNVEEVKREHKEAADRVVEAVHTALAEGLNQQQKHGNSSGRSSSGDGSSGEASAGAAAAGDSGAAAGSKRKQGAAGAAKAGGSPAKKRKPTMLDLVEGSDSGSDSDSDGSDDK